MDLVIALNFQNIKRVINSSGGFGGVWLFARGGALTK